jgi:hypothetical protein
MRALQELPERDKDELLPILPLKPWQSSHHLDSTLSRIEEAYGQRPYFVDIAEPEIVDARRPVHDELDELRNAVGGYSNWCAFIEARRNLIPSLQLGNPAELSHQLDRLYRLGRGLLVRIEEYAFPRVADIARTVAAQTNSGLDVCFFLDFGKGARDLLTRQAEAVGYMQAILAQASNAYLSLSASSFPDGFVGVENQDIYERQLFDGVAITLRHPGLIYSDRGSARAERQSGGGGTPSPRVDFAQRHRWTFFRDDTILEEGLDFEQRKAVRKQCYINQARAAVASPVWDPNLRVWGTQMVDRTSLGDSNAINSPVSSTAARINIHLHQQLFYDDPSAIYETDEEWSDD